MAAMTGAARLKQSIDVRYTAAFGLNRTLGRYRGMTSPSKTKR